jgi:hypothetical protein
MSVGDVILLVSIIVFVALGERLTHWVITKVRRKK